MMANITQVHAIKFKATTVVLSEKNTGKCCYSSWQVDNIAVSAGQTHDARFIAPVHADERIDALCEPVTFLQWNH